MPAMPITETVLNAGTVVKPNETPLIVNSTVAAKAGSAFVKSIALMYAVSLVDGPNKTVSPTAVAVVPVLGIG